MNLNREFMLTTIRTLTLAGFTVMWGLTTSAPAQDAHGHDEHEEHAHEEEDRKAVAHVCSDPNCKNCAADEHATDEHEGHDHDAHEGQGHDEHADHQDGHADGEVHQDGPAEAGHDEGEAHEDDHAGEGHEEHAEEEGLRLTAKQRKRFGIVVQAAGAGRLRNEVSLPGEIVFNEDRVAHVVPRVPGIAREVRRTVGDRVKTGDVLAVIDSSELASEKLNYLSAVTEVGCCQFELPRARAINDNVLKMLKLLETSPSVEQLQKAAPGEMGKYGSRLISTYAEYVLTRKAYERERILMSKKISSEGDFLTAESKFKKAQAEYYGARDSVAFEVKQNMLEATRDRQLAEFQAETAKQKLYMLGLSKGEVDGLTGSQPADDDAPKAAAHVCTDPNCKGCAADEHKAPLSRARRAHPGRYEIKAPFDGVIVQKHITLGEHVGEESDIFTIVDTSSVWVSLTVHTRNLAAVRPGQDAVLRVDHSGAQARGKVTMVTPFVDEATRSATARVVLDNRDGRWTPGTFATGFISSSEEDVPVVVPRTAVQNIEGRNVVFAEHEGHFEMIPVTLGRSDRTSVEITAGLEAGARYVAKGAFQLKATVITSNLDSHAGHGH